MADPTLDILRQQIDQIDKNLIHLIADRMEIVKKIGQYKKIQHLQALDQKRWNTVLKSRMEMAEQTGLDSGYIKKIYEIIHEYALKIEHKDL